MTQSTDAPDLALAASLTTAQATTFLASHSGRLDLPPEDCERIAAALELEPDALLLAARLFAARPDARAGAYLEALSEHAAATPDRPDYPRAYRAALLTSFEIVEHDPSMQGHSATSLLALAAFTPDRALPAAIFDQPSQAYPSEIAPFVADPVLRGQALALLSRLGLASVDPVDGSFTVAEITKGVVRDLLTEADDALAWQAAAASLVEADSGIVAAEILPPAEAVPRPPLPLAAEVDDGVGEEPEAPAVPGVDRGTVNRLVDALRAPASALPIDAEATPDDEPIPLELDTSRGPPKVFTAESLLAREAGLVRPASAADPQTTKRRFLDRLLGRRPN